jgi:hypothetical protein
LAAGLAAGACAGIAVAQPCTVEWNVVRDGAVDGYIQPMFGHDDGSGEQLYVGGSFGGISGTPGTQMVARLDPSTGTWSSVGGGLNFGTTNGFVTSFDTFDAGAGDELIVAGFFFGAFGVNDTKSIAKWDGSEWSSLGAGFPTNTANSIWGMTTWDFGGSERLYVGGGFDVIGGVAANGLASWDGSAWRDLGSGITGAFSPVVFDLQVFDDGSGEQLYAVGRFDTVDGVFSPFVARWDGSQWSTVGSPMGNTSALASIEAVTVFDDGSGPALYVGGNRFVPSGQPVASVAKWDGMQWTTIGQNVGGRVTSLQAFDDGSGPALYLGGTATPGINYIARLEAGQWVPVDGGVTGTSITGNFPSVFGLAVFQDDLYVGGNFTQIGSLTNLGGIASRNACLTSCYADCDGNETLDVFDFLCFQDAFVANDPYADCDGNTIFDVFDFLCFQDAFVTGCP